MSTEPTHVGRYKSAWVLLVGLVVLPPLFACLNELGYSSSAAPWLETIAANEGGSPFGAIGLAIRRFSAVIATDDWRWTIECLQIGLACLQVALMVICARGAGVGRFSVFLGLIALLWPVSRQALAVVSAESLMATCSLGVVVAAQRLESHPQWSAIGLATALWLLALSHPIGLPAAVLLAVLAAIWPRPRTVQEGRSRPRQTITTRPIWSAWIVAILLFIVLLMVSMPGGRLMALWHACLASLREPLTHSVVGGGAQWPVVGPAIGLAARVSPVIGLLAMAAAGQALGRSRSGGASPLAAMTMGWLLIATLTDRPTPGALDFLVVIAPLIVILATVSATSWFTRLAQSQHLAWQPVSFMLLFSLLVAIAGDGLDLASGEPRSALARAIGMSHDSAVDTPAVVTEEDLRLLEDQSIATAVMPSQREGNRVLGALKKLSIIGESGPFFAPFSSKQMLLHMPATDPVSGMWRYDLPLLVCTRSGRSCLYRLQP